MAEHLLQAGVSASSIEPEVIIGQLDWQLGRKAECAEEQR